MFLRIQNNGNDAVILLYNSDRMCYIVRKKYEGKRKMNRGQTKGAKLREVRSEKQTSEVEAQRDIS